MKNILIVLISFLAVSCANPTAKLEKDLQYASLTTTLKILPPIKDTIRIDYYSENENENNIYSDIIQTLMNTKTKYTLTKSEYSENIVDKTRYYYKIQGLERDKIGFYSMVFSYKVGGRIAKNSRNEQILSELSTITYFPVSIQVTDKEKMPMLDYQPQAIYKYSVSINIHEGQKNKSKYDFLDSDAALLADIRNTLFLAKNEFNEKYTKHLCEMTRIAVVNNKNLIRINKDPRTEYYYKKGAFTFEIDHTNFCEENKQNYYKIKLKPNNGFHVTGIINPDVVLYKNLSSSQVNVRIDSFSVQLWKLLESQTFESNFESSDISFRINRFHFFKKNMELSVSVSNNSKNYIDVKYISFYIGGKVLTIESNLNLAPQSTTSKDKKISFEITQDLQHYLDAYVENGETTINLGVSSQYLIDGKILSMLKKKSLQLSI